jgi:hypothetical protein
VGSKGWWRELSAGSFDNAAVGTVLVQYFPLSAAVLFPCCSAWGESHILIAAGPL